MISCALYVSSGGRPPATPRGYQRLADALAKLPSPAAPRPPSAPKLRLLALIENEPARVETDAQGSITAINPAFTTMCGFSFAEVRGRKPGSFLQGPLTEPEPVHLLRTAIAAGRPCDVAVVNYHKNGSPYRVQISLAPIEDESGRLAGFRAVETKLPSEDLLGS